MQNRSWVLAACLLVIAAVVLLAPSLGSLHFEPARPVSRSVDIARPQILSVLRIDEDTSAREIVLAWLAVMVPLILLALLLPPELRKRVLQQLFRFALFVLALVLALRYRLIHLPEFQAGSPGAGEANSLMATGAGELDSFAAPILPAWVTFLISFAIFSLLGVGVYSIYALWQRNRTRRYSSLNAIATVARESLAGLAEGRRWSDVVVEAYARMLDAVRDGRGVQRDVAWTPREFAAKLDRKGLPSQDVEELTRLFEAARYGDGTTDEMARRRAVVCLESILRACAAAA